MNRCSPDISVRLVVLSDLREFKTHSGHMRRFGEDRLDSQPNAYEIKALPHGAAGHFL